MKFMKLTKGSFHKHNKWQLTIDPLFTRESKWNDKGKDVTNLKLLTIANSFLLNIAEHENFSANKNENANYCCHFHIY